MCYGTAYATDDRDRRPRWRKIRQAGRRLHHGAGSTTRVFDFQAYPFTGRELLASTSTSRGEVSRSHQGL